jgi:hypothetical protein
MLLTIVQAAPTTTDFHHGASLFVSKWAVRQKEITNWFDVEYFGWRKCFFGAASEPGIPCTNNPLENGNRLLKEFGTKHVR